MPETAVHQPVMVAEVLRLLAPRSGHTYVDATLGLGGHTEAILLASAPAGMVIGFEWDEEAADLAVRRLARFGPRVQVVRKSYLELDAVLWRLGVEKVDGVLFDLGVSSLQLDRGARGFSFQEDGPLDMRMDRRLPRTAADIVAQASAARLADIFYHLGEERQARRIAAHIVEARRREPITRTLQLAGLVAEAVPRRFHPRRHHVATRVFQALRIAVNRELANLEEALGRVAAVLRPGGVVAVIAFHSLEDRIVKRFFREQPGWEVLTARPLRPGAEECRDNPRARSARLRAARRA